MNAEAGHSGGTQTPGPGTSAVSVQPRHLPRDPKATQTVDELRHSELMAIHRSLRRLCGIDHKWWSLHLEWDKIFGAGAILFIGDVSPDTPIAHPPSQCGPQSALSVSRPCC